METKDPKSTESAGEATGTENKDPKSTATSDETLHDLEKTEQVTEERDDKTSNSEPSGVPSPDGEFAERRGGTDDAGPM